MKITKLNNHFNENQLIILKDEIWLKKQKHAGSVVAKVLLHCGNLIKSKTPNLNLLDLEKEALSIIKENDCSATFYGFHGFPGQVCISVNNELVHGIPHDYVLQDGDVISIDLGATYEGVIADAARTWIYGAPKTLEHKRLLNTCWKALKDSIKTIKVGKRLGIIGYSIYNNTKSSGFGLITNYGGHGLDIDKPHSYPFVNNKSQQHEGIRIQDGLSIAIEPMLVIGNVKTRKLDDGWTIVTEGIGCHFEDSITLLNNEVHVVTSLLDNEEKFEYAN